MRSRQSKTFAQSGTTSAGSSTFPQGKKHPAFAPPQPAAKQKGASVRRSQKSAVPATHVPKFKETLRLLQDALANVDDVILISEGSPVDFPGPRVVWVNDAFTRMTGYTREEIVGKTPRILQGISSDRRTLDMVRQKLENWEPVDVEILNYRKNGEEFWVDLKIHPIADETGWFTHWVAVQRDATARKAEIGRLQEADRILKEANTALEQRVQERTMALSRLNIELQQEISERKGVEVERESLLNEALMRADRDALTNLLNHRTFHRKLEEEASKAVREQTSLGVFVMDVDHFKFFNDSYGHMEGDLVLKNVAKTLTQSFRTDDIISRFGGDEFAVIMPDISETLLSERLSDLQSALDNLVYENEASRQTVPIRVSFGFARFPEDAGTWREVLEMADARLMRRKHGKDSIETIIERLREQIIIEGEDDFITLIGLVTAVDGKDRYTRRHSEDVLLYSKAIAEELCLGADAVRDIQIAALLHDLGKVGVPEYILRKPGTLSDAEFAYIRQHPVVGATIVSGFSAFAAVLPTIRHHHERWDGTGYPDKLRGEETPLLARVLAVADAFSAMTTDRPYRKGMMHGDALHLLEEGRGIQWDATCVDAFLKVYRMALLDYPDSPDVPGLITRRATETVEEFGFFSNVGDV